MNSKTLIRKIAAILLGPWAIFRLKARMLPAREGFFYKVGRWMDTHAYQKVLKSFGQDTVIHPSVDIRHPEKVSIGSLTNINHGAELHGAGGITIGNNTLISFKVLIFSDMRFYRNNNLIRLQKKRVKPVYIGDDVWVGAGSIILPGIIISDHAIIGAGAVVTKNVKEWDIVAGNPAQVIGSRLDMIASHSPNIHLKRD